MVHRIRLWRSKNQSFAARVTLINFVLLSIHIYWAIIMILLKTGAENLNHVCRNFLWHVYWENTSPGSVAWNYICTPKKIGGLGLRNMKEWNKIAIGKHVLAIAKK